MLNEQNFSKLDILHHVSSGFKAYCADYAYAAMDALRQACGGAGFLMASGLPFNFVNQAPIVTYEGVNVIMYQQSSRFLLKNAKKAFSGKKTKGYMAYLNDAKALLSSVSQAKTIEQFL